MSKLIQLEWISICDQVPFDKQQVIIHDGINVYYAVKHKCYDGWEYQIAEDLNLIDPEPNEILFETNAIMEKDIVGWVPIESLLTID